MKMSCNCKRVAIAEELQLQKSSNCKRVAIAKELHEKNYLQTICTLKKSSRCVAPNKKDTKSCNWVVNLVISPSASIRARYIDELNDFNLPINLNLWPISQYSFTAKLNQLLHWISRIHLKFICWKKKWKFINININPHPFPVYFIILYFLKIL